ncbi:MAG: flagellar biosynthesis protein FlhB [Tepidisphaeraceae bacterium]
MADESAGEKTEAPTPKRREQAREQGQIPKSADLTAAALMLSAVVLLGWSGEGLIAVCRDIMLNTLGPDGIGSTEVPEIRQVMLSLFIRVGGALAPILLGMMLVAILCNIAQVGFFFSLERVQPKLSALNPTKGFSRLFSGGQGAVSLLMNLAKMGMIAAVAYSAIADRMALIAGAQKLDYVQLLGLGAQLMHDIAFRIAIFLLVLAIIDYAYQRYKINKELKMTKQEVKEEMKSMDGDPHVKQRRRQIAMQRHRQRLKTAVPTADVIVTNPTHYAIALKYEAGTMNAPKVVAKGADELAKVIREIAIENGIPLLERPPLARALYRTVEVGHEIPEEYFAAVAEILAYVYEISGKAKAIKAA